MSHQIKCKRSIKSSDMLLRPIKQENNHFITEIWEFDGNKTLIELPVQKVIDWSCRFYGDSYINRKNQTKYISGIANKSPILLTPIFSLYFFPTHSDRVPENCWINPFYVDKIKPLKGTRCKIIFVNDQSIILNVSYHSLKHQMLNCAYLHFLMHRELAIKTGNPEKPIDYEKSNFKIFETLAQYALIERAKNAKLDKEYERNYLSSNKMFF
ncbi:competence protein ComK [Staphylococcus felis]|uniref:competence protein ComK n=2 Tax=Staphylococcus felis TaxID=46127 RepID=UPI000E23C59F|nr:competence protein ComK [Staphylococcus felis]REH82135.1 competence protein ComK [Staphylococcus felis]REI03915.1 competence protein ComK [Staphylococcus felis]REI25235.1 competence protein ComK [Staphylococcus felis]UXR86221.1 competence protein ComK [Staphylococcus felis]